VAGIATAILLVALGYCDGHWRALRWSFLVPAAALAADLITFAPVSPQTGPDANLYSYAALFYLPVYAALILLGITAHAIAPGRRTHP
jgi:hypothetical protein